MFRRAISSDSQERVSNGCCTHCDIDLTLRVIDTSSRFMHYDNVSLLYLHENGKYELNQVSLNWFALNFKGAFTCFGKVYRQTRPRPPPLLTETSKNVPKKIVHPTIIVRSEIFPECVKFLSFAPSLAKDWQKKALKQNDHAQLTADVLRSHSTKQVALICILCTTGV